MSYFISTVYLILSSPPYDSNETKKSMEDSLEMLFQEDLKYQLNLIKKCLRLKEKS